jgi:pimeloyl-ACP methyl ester carboxylesterase
MVARGVMIPRSIQTVAVLVFGAAVTAGCLPPRVGAAFLVDPARTPIVGEPSVPYRAITFESGDVTLSGWLFRPAGTPRGLVIFLHGRTANRSRGIPVAEALVPRGYAVFAYDQRAHGRSGGQHCTWGALEKRDLARAIDAVGIGPVVVMGHSMGAAIALQAAAEEPRVRGVIAVASFSDLRTVIAESIPTFASAREVGAAVRLAERWAGFEVDAISPERAAAHVEAPVLLIHGSRDTVVRPAHSRRILAALAGPKQLLVVEGATHHDVLAYPAVWSTINGWLDAL